MLCVNHTFRSMVKLSLLGCGIVRLGMLSLSLKGAVIGQDRTTRRRFGLTRKGAPGKPEPTQTDRSGQATTSDQVRLIAKFGDPSRRIIIASRGALVERLG